MKHAIFTIALVLLFSCKPVDTGETGVSQAKGLYATDDNPFYKADHYFLEIFPVYVKEKQEPLGYCAYSFRSDVYSSDAPVELEKLNGSFAALKKSYEANQTQENQTAFAATALSYFNSKVAFLKKQNLVWQSPRIIKGHQLRDGSFSKKMPKLDTSVQSASGWASVGSFSGVGALMGIVSIVSGPTSIGASQTAAAAAMNAASAAGTAEFLGGLGKTGYFVFTTGPVILVGVGVAAAVVYYYASAAVEKQGEVAKTEILPAALQAAMNPFLSVKVKGNQLLKIEQALKQVPVALSPECPTFESFKFDAPNLR